MFKVFFWLVLLLVVGFIIKPRPDFIHHQARQLPWQLDDHTQANYQSQVLDDGRLHISITHLPLNNITPEMVSWFYKNLPVSQVRFQGETLPWYHIFHPTEHGYIDVIEPAIDAKTGMDIGSLVQRKEWFGEYNSKGAGRIVEFDQTGMTVIPELAGLHFGKIRHSYTKTEYGTEYKVDSVIGSDLPIIGRFINLVIRYKMFPEAMLKEWLRHQVEEVASLNHFLPELYRAEHQGQLYFLEIVSDTKELPLSKK